jgi:hypothetical protein
MEGEIGGACSIHETDDECIKVFGVKTRRKDTTTKT